MFRGWKVVAGAGSGIAFGSAVFTGSAFSLLAAAIGKDFGWPQSTLALGATIVLFAQFLAYPATGGIADKFGSRKVALISIAFFGVILALLSQIGNSTWQYLGAFLIMGLFASGTNVISYTGALTKWFDRKRGLALGVAAACQAFGAMVMPQLFQRVTDAAGWSTALLVLCAIQFVICIPLVALLVRDNPAPFGLHPDGELAPPALPKFAEPRAAAAARANIATDARFWKMAIAFAVMGMSFYGVVTNAAFVLRANGGLEGPQIANIMTLSGASVLIGRIGFGILLDKFSARVVATGSLMAASLFYFLYGHGGSFGIMAFAAVLGGISIGGESDLMPYMAGRYFGKDTVGRVFGLFLCAFSLGAAIGPYAFARLTEIYGTPSVPLFGLSALQIVPAVLFLALGPYPDPLPGEAVRGAVPAH
jgi:MFS family permease